MAVDLNAKRTADGADFLTITDKGSVPALQLDNGAVLTEVAAVLQYIVARMAARPAVQQARAAETPKK